MPKSFNVGDEVAYAAKFLKSTGQFTGDNPHLRGRVAGTIPFGNNQLCLIEWTLHGNPYPIESEYHNDGLGRVIAPNLTLISRIAVDAALAG